MSTLEPWVLVGTELPQWKAFIGLHTMSVASLTGMLLLIWWTGVKRPPVVITMALSFILNSISNLMAINTWHRPVPTPLALVGYTFSLCGTTAIACTCLSTTVFVWAMLQRSFGRRVPFARHLDHILLIFPWIMYLVDMIFTFAWYPGHKEELHMSLLGGYSNGIPTIVSHFVVAGVIVLSLILDIWAIVLVIKNRSVARQTSIIGASETSQLNYTFITRVLIFGLANAGGLITAILCYAQPNAHAPALYQASCGTCLFLVFGTQSDAFVAAWLKLSPPAVAGASSVPPAPRYPRTPAFPSHIGRLSTFWASVTTFPNGGLQQRRSSDDSDMQSLAVPTLLRDVLATTSRHDVEAGLSGPSTTSPSPLQTPKVAFGVWDEKSGGDGRSHSSGEEKEGGGDGPRIVIDRASTKSAPSEESDKAEFES